MQRRLVTILASDLVGYSRLVADDEEGVISRFQQAWEQVLSPVIKDNAGRVFKKMGDGFLAEFASPVNAAKAAISIQNKMTEWEASVGESDRLRFRIGINTGEAILDGSDLLGDCVNIAARLEGIAPPGGICLSKKVEEACRGVIKEQLTRIGPQRVKNIPEPIDVWRLELAEVRNPVVEQLAHALPENPSIVVRPFSNLSSDSEQAFFCDGLTEDITSALSRFKSLFIVGRATALSLEDTAQMAGDFARALGVQYVLDGSVRRSGNRIRVSVRLTDAINDQHIWSDQFDRDLEDVFEVQDEITQSVVTMLSSRIQDAEIERARRKAVPQLRSWELIARAQSEMDRFTAEGHRSAGELLETAIERDETSAEAFAVLSMCRAMEALYSWNRPPPESIRLSAEMADRAHQIDPTNDTALVSLGMASLFLRDHKQAESRLRAALDRNPNSVAAIGLLGMVLAWLREEIEGKALLERAIRANPRDHWASHAYCHLALFAFREKDYGRAFELCEQGLQINSQNPSLLRMTASCLGWLGDERKSASVLDKLGKLVPAPTISGTRAGLPVAFEEDAVQFFEGLRLAGMPE